MKVKVRCPTRIDLSGGTLDLWPLYNLVPHSMTINAAINIYTEAHLEVRDDLGISFKNSNTGYQKDYNSIDFFLKDKNTNTNILKPIVEYFNPQFGFNITLYSESPMGGGLGGSSSLMIAIISAFATALNKKFSTEELVFLAHNLESQLLKTPTGTQDYIPPIEGGLLAIRYRPDGFEVQKIDFDLDSINERLIIVYTGKPHHSGLNNWEVFKKAVEKNKKVLAALSGIRNCSHLMFDMLKKKDLQLHKIFKSEFKHRISLAKSFSSPEIRKLEKMALKNGANSVKICGAGGGGCVFIWCSPQKRERIIEICQKEKFQILNSKVISQGISILTN